MMTAVRLLCNCTVRGERHSTGAVVVTDQAEADRLICAGLAFPADYEMPQPQPPRRRRSILAELSLQEVTGGNR